MAGQCAQAFLDALISASDRPGLYQCAGARRHDAGSASINRRETGTVLADYAAWLGEQPLSSRTRAVYPAAVTAFVTWLGQRDAGPGTRWSRRARVISGCW